MGFFDEIFNSEAREQKETVISGGEKPVAKISGTHCVGFNLKDDAKVTVELFADRIVFKHKLTYLAECDMEDVLSVEYRHEDFHIGSRTTAEEEVGLASTVAMMKGDWAAAYFLKPNRSTYETTHKIERRYFLEVETFKNTVVLEVKSQDELIDFVEECSNYIDCYEEDGEEAYLKEAQLKFMTKAQFEEFCVKYLDYHRFYGVVLLPKSDDDRVTIVAEKDEVKYAIRCECGSDKIEAGAVEKIESGRKSYRCHVGLVMSNARFSEQAKQLAQENIILLWDRERLQ